MRVLPVVALLVLLAPGPAGAVERVAVYRGSASNVAAAVPVYRGSAAAPGHRGAAPVGAIGGQRLWFVDPGGDELVACRMVRTFTVGVERIRCARRRLPAG
jgi:hypothetical protein